MQEALKGRVRLTVGLIDINWEGLKADPAGMTLVKGAAAAGINRVVEQAGQHLELKPSGTGAPRSAP